MKKNWHVNFLEYMNFIYENEVYKGLPTKIKKDGTIQWIAGKKTDVGKARLKWADQKAKELGLEIKPGVYAKLMYTIHPTKYKVCQVCGKSMSLNYEYLNQNMVNKIFKKFRVKTDTHENIYTVTSKLLSNGIDENTIIQFYIETFNVYNSECLDLSYLLDFIVNETRLGRINNKLLGPGAMSNFPDRFDGFHTYNRCCRSKEDTGRSKENMRSYGKDRRAYENWSDGNIHAANNFMNSDYFKGYSADHIGPISLGFVHDSKFIQKMSSNDNSSKRDRITTEDIELLIQLEDRYQESSISWFAKLIWDFIKDDFAYRKKFNPTIYRQMLKENIVSFMNILYILVSETNIAGEKFLSRNYIEPKLNDFNYSYEFIESGEIIKQTLRNRTESTNKEAERYKRIAIQSILDFQNKDNRKIQNIIPQNLQVELENLISMIKKNEENNLIKSEFEKIIFVNQQIIIQKYKSLDL